MRAAVHFPFGSARGGAEKLCLVLAKELVGLGYEVTLFTDGLASDASRPRLLPGAASRSGPGSASPSRPLASTPSTALAQWVIDFVHARALRSASPDLFVNLIYKSRLPGIGRRNILYCQFPDLDAVIEGRWRRRYVELVRTAHRRVIARHSQGFLATYDDVWANSVFTAGHVRAMWWRSADVLYPACAMHQPAAKENVNAQRRALPSAPGTAPYKAQDRLIEAFARVHQEHPTWRLHLAGGLSASSRDAEYFDRLREAASGLPVTLHPNASHAELPSSTDERPSTGMRRASAPTSSTTPLGRNISESRRSRP